MFVIFLLLGIAILCTPCPSGAALISADNTEKDNNEMVQLLRSMNQNLQTLRNIAFFVFKLAGVAFIILGIVLLVNSL